MNPVRSDLVVRLDEEASKFVFFLRRKGAASATDSASEEPSFSVDISFEDLQERGADGAERLIGESVLGFFDTLTDGRLNLPRHYIDDSNEAKE